MNPKTSELVSKKTSVQAKRALLNLKLLAQANGFKLSDAVKCNVFLTNMADFSEVNTVYGKFFKENPPPRTTVAVHQLPKGAAFEIDAVFFKP